MNKTTACVIAMIGLVLAAGAPVSAGAAFTVAGKIPGLEQRLRVYGFWSNGTDEGAITGDAIAVGRNRGSEVRRK